jgi:hypothetical protein
MSRVHNEQDGKGNAEQEQTGRCHGADCATVLVVRNVVDAVGGDGPRGRSRLRGGEEVPTNEPATAGPVTHLSQRKVSVLRLAQRVRQVLDQAFVVEFLQGHGDRLGI